MPLYSQPHPFFSPLSRMYKMLFIQLPIFFLWKLNWMESEIRMQAVCFCQVNYNVIHTSKQMWWITTAYLLLIAFSIASLGVKCSKSNHVLMNSKWIWILLLPIYVTQAGTLDLFIMDNSFQTHLSFLKLMQIRLTLSSYLSSFFISRIIVPFQTSYWNLFTTYIRSWIFLMFCFCWVYNINNSICENRTIWK